MYDKEMFTLAADRPALLEKLGREKLLSALRMMVRIRNFEIRSEAAYQQGKIGGFLHTYIGQEAIATAAVDAMGRNNWWIATYRCHAMALLLGESVESVMAELYGKKCGNAQGRGGSMHLYTDRLLGGFGIVGGQVPIAIGAAFSAKYLGTEEISICFLGDGAVAQGAFHESLNLAALWDLPCLFVIENNQWGMGTHVRRAIAAQRIAEDHARAYGLKGYTADGMDYLTCWHAFHELKREIQRTGRPLLVEMITRRFRGHSVSDPGQYRSRDQLQEEMGRDPLLLLRKGLEEKGWLDEASFKELNKEERERVIAAMKYADEASFPDIAELGEGVFASGKEGK